MGTHIVEVTLDGEAIASSPFSVAVDKKKSKSDMEEDAKALEGNEPLHTAAMRGNVSEVKKLIETDKADVNVRNTDGRSPLYLASWIGSRAACEVLLKKGAIVDHPTRAGWTPLFAAAERGHLGCVQDLVAAKANVETLSSEGTTPLYHAACKGHTDVCRFLLEEAKANIEGGEPGGWRALQGAVYHTKAETVDYLVDAGADVNARNELKMKSYSALHLACGRKKPFNSAIDKLLAHKGGEGEARGCLLC